MLSDPPSALGQHLKADTAASGGLVSAPDRRTRRGKYAHQLFIDNEIDLDTARDLTEDRLNRLLKKTSDRLHEL